MALAARSLALQQNVSNFRRCQDSNVCRRRPFIEFLFALRSNLAIQSLSLFKVRIPLAAAAAAAAAATRNSFPFFGCLRRRRRKSVCLVGCSAPPENHPSLRFSLCLRQHCGRQGCQMYLGYFTSISLHCTLQTCTFPYSQLNISLIEIPLLVTVYPDWVE
jgi:hypothetical protein